MSLNSIVDKQFFGGCVSPCKGVEIAGESLLENVVASGILENKVVWIASNRGRGAGTNAQLADGFIQPSEDESACLSAVFVNYGGGEI